MTGRRMSRPRLPIAIIDAKQGPRVIATVPEWKRGLLGSKRPTAPPPALPPPTICSTGAASRRRRQQPTVRRGCCLHRTQDSHDDMRPYSASSSSRHPTSARNLQPATKRPRLRQRHLRCTNGVVTLMKKRTENYIVRARFCERRRHSTHHAQE